MPIAYLSGGIQNNPDLGKGFRDRWTTYLEELGHTALDVLALGNKYHSLYPGTHPYRKYPLSTDTVEFATFKKGCLENYVKADMEMIVNVCDYVIMEYNDGSRKGAGSFSEVHEAWRYGKHVFIVCETDEDVSKVVPGWLLAISTKAFPSDKALYDYLAALPVGILNSPYWGNPSTNGETFLCRNCAQVIHYTKESKLYLNAMPKTTVPNELHDTACQPSLDTSNRITVYKETILPGRE